MVRVLPLPCPEPSEAALAQDLVLELALTQRQLFTCRPDGSECKPLLLDDLRYHWGRLELFCEALSPHPSGQVRYPTQQSIATRTRWWGSKPVSRGEH